MVIYAAQPSIEELDKFSRLVRSFPVSASQVREIARRRGAPRRVVDFYMSFAPDRRFENREELVASSEQVELMRLDKSRMPLEEERAAEDD